MSQPEGHRQVRQQRTDIDVPYELVADQTAESGHGSSGNYGLLSVRKKFPGSAARPF